MDLNLKHLLPAMGLDLHFTEVQRGPLLFQGVLPIDHLPAHRTLPGGTLTIGCRAREVILLRVFAHRAARGKDWCQARHAPAIWPGPRRWLRGGRKCEA